MKEEWKNEFELYKSRLGTFFNAIGNKEKIGLSNEELEIVFTAFKNFAEQGDSASFKEIYHNLWDMRVAPLMEIIERDGSGENFTEEQRKEWESINSSFEVASYPINCSCCGVNKPNMFYIGEPSFTMAMMKLKFAKEWDRSMQDFYDKLTHCDVCYIEYGDDEGNGGITIKA